MKTTRREFIKGSAAALTALGLPITLAAVPKKTANLKKGLEQAHTLSEEIVHHTTLMVKRGGKWEWVGTVERLSDGSLVDEVMETSSFQSNLNRLLPYPGRIVMRLSNTAHGSTRFYGHFIKTSPCQFKCQFPGGSTLQLEGIVTEFHEGVKFMEIGIAPIGTPIWTQQ